MAMRPGPGRNVGGIVDNTDPFMFVRSPAAAEISSRNAGHRRRTRDASPIDRMPEAVVTVTVDPSAAAIAVAWLIARMPCEPDVMLEPDIVVMATLPLLELKPPMP
jgi:hypothetical protein